MSKDESKKAKKSKKKSKVKKKKNRSHHDRRSESQEGQAEGQAGKDATKSEKKSRDECNLIGDGSRGRGEKSIPIKLSVDVVSKNSDAPSSSGVWSWGAAFSVASKVQPDDDLDDDFLTKAANNSEEGKQNSFVNISQLANNHSQCLPNDTTAEGNDAKGRKLKRNRTESSIGSDKADDDADDCENSDLSQNSDDIPLEGRMVPNPTDDGDMILVLVHEQTGTVYSSQERTKDGRRLAIGKLVKGLVKFDPVSIKDMKRLDEGDETAGPTFPYPTNPDDHCETPLQSYKDILPILNEICNKLEVDKSSMRIYDPYFCDGSVVRHLSYLGFRDVHNQKEDCYDVWESNLEPEFDVFITNPPYSEDHIEKLMRHITSPSFGSKPWLLLMPQWVHKKEYYINATTKNRKRPCNPFYIVPKKRYVYLPPANFREKKESDVHKKSSPFVSMWYCWGGDDRRNEELMNAFRSSSVSSDCDVARSKSALGDLRRGGGGSKGKKKKKARTGN